MEQAMTLALSFLGVVAIVLGLRMEATPEVTPESSCPVCIAHHGTCGCYLSHVVCCDGYDAYGCVCQ